MSKVENIKEIRFSKKIFGGYDSDSVDKFIDDIQKLILNLENENIILKEKLNEFENEIKAHKEEEVNIRRAIVNSQKIADAAVIDAGVRSKYIIKEANEKVSRLINATKTDVENRLNVSKKLCEYFKNFKSKFTATLREQLDFLDNLTFDDTTEIEKYLCSLEDKEIEFLRNENDNSKNYNDFDIDSYKNKTLSEFEKEIKSI